EAFDADHKLADDFQAGNRVDAACAGALAGCGQGQDAASLDGLQRVRLRQQARDWLTADLASWRHLLERTPPIAIKVQEVLQNWQQDADLACVREDTALALLPANEQGPWHRLWADVEALRRQAGSSYTETWRLAYLTAKEREQSYPFQMSAG